MDVTLNLNKQESLSQSLKQIDNDRFALTTAFWQMIQSGNAQELRWDTLSENARVAMLTASRWKGIHHNKLLARALDDPSRNVRIAAVRIIADGKLAAFRDKISSMLPAEGKDTQFYMTVEAALKELEN